MKSNAISERMSDVSRRKLYNMSNKARDAIEDARDAADHAAAHASIGDRINFCQDLNRAISQCRSAIEILQTLDVDEDQAMICLAA